MQPRQLIVRRAEAGRPLALWLQARLGLPPRDLQRLIREGLVRINGKPALDPARPLRQGQRVALRPAADARKKPAPRTATDSRRTQSPTRPKPREARERHASGPSLPLTILCHVDDQVIVVNKPAGLTTMRHAEEAAEFGPRGRRFLPPTLADLLPNLLARKQPGRKPGPVIAVHRLDKDTSGLVVFARDAASARKLDAQFRAHATDRLYRAVVRGAAQEARLESRLVRDRGDGRRGSSPDGSAGQRAVTHVRVLERLGSYTLVECRLETGRTHQVRIHLGEAGTPLCGERIYDRPPHGRPSPDDSGMSRTALHAATLAFDHPATGQRLSFQAPLPPDMVELLQRLRHKNH